MLLKKKIVLFCEEGRFPPAVCVVRPESSGVFASVLPSAEKLYALTCGSVFQAEKNEGDFCIKNYSEKTCLVAVINGRVYFEKKAGLTAAEIKKRLFANKSESGMADNVDKVKIPYDDEAISTVNYYPQNYAKKAVNRLKTCEKGDLFNYGDIIRGQHSTFYPHKNNSEEKYDAGDYYEENERFKTKEGKNAKAEGDKNDACKENGCSRGSGGEIGGEGGGGIRLYSLKEKTEAILKEFPRENLLERVMSGCRFARITYAGDKWYVAGMSEENGKPEYLFFGVPCKKGDTPPKEFSGKEYFVPVGDDCGYFLLCQDFYTGEIL